MPSTLTIVKVLAALAVLAFSIYLADRRAKRRGQSSPDYGNGGGGTTSVDIEVR